MAKESGTKKKDLLASAKNELAMVREALRTSSREEAQERGLHAALIRCEDDVVALGGKLR